MSFLSPAHHHVNTEIFQKQIYGKKEKHLSDRADEQSLDKQGWAGGFSAACVSFILVVVASARLWTKHRRHSVFIKMRLSLSLLHVAYLEICSPSVICMKYKHYQYSHSCR